MSESIWRAILTSCLAAGVIVSVGPDPVSAGQAAIAETPMRVGQPHEMHSLDRLERVISLFDRSELFVRFVEGVEQAVRHGDTPSAERQIHDAGDLATLATIFTDYLRDPAFPQILQKLRSSEKPASGEHPIDMDVDIETSQPSVDPAGSNTDRTHDALKEERRLNESLQQKLSLAESDVKKLEAQVQQQTAEFAKGNAEWQDRLLHEKNRADGIARDLSLAEAKFRDLETKWMSESAVAERRISDLQMALNEGQVLYEAALRDASLASAKVCIPDTDGRAPTDASDVGSSGFGSIFGDGVVRTWASSGLGVPLMAIVPRLAMFEESVRIGLAPQPSATRSPTDTGASGATSGAGSIATNSAVRDAALSTTEDRQAERALILLKDGDISGARLLLEKAAAAGHARSLFLLAETFDPHVLLERRVRGISADRQIARELYERARALGVHEAAERLEALDR